MNGKTLAIIFLVILSTIFLYRYLKTPFVVDDKTIIFGTAAGYAPFVSVNDQGEYEGFDIDVARALAEKMGKKFVLKDMGSMTGLFMALAQGNIDAIIWGLSITAERREKVTMINYQGEVTTAYPLLFWEKVPAGVQSIEDMKGMTVCVEPTSSQDAVLSKYPFINKCSTEKVDDALLNIQYGKADAAFVEPAIAQKFKRKYPQIQVVEVPLAPEDHVHGVGIAIKKEKVNLIEQVEQAIAQLKDEGVIQEYEKKWGIV